MELWLRRRPRPPAALPGELYLKIFYVEPFLNSQFNPYLIFQYHARFDFPSFSLICLHLSHKLCAVLCLVAQSCLTLCDPMNCNPPGSSVHADSPGKNTEVGCHDLCQGDLPNPGVEPRSPTSQADSLWSEPPGKPKNTGVGSLFLLQGNLLTQESNRGLLHCGWLLYLLSYQGSPLREGSGEGSWLFLCRLYWPTNFFASDIFIWFKNQSYISLLK